MFALLAPLALAQDPAPAPEPAPAASTTSTTKTRKNKMEVGVRGRYLTLPDGIMDIPYENHYADDYPDRPRIAAYSLGLEFVLDAGSANGIFYVEYVGSLLEEGYWDDRDDKDDFEDGSWIRPNQLGMIGLGANYMAEFPVVNWFSIMVGGGLGIGIVTGNIEQWYVNDGEHAVTDEDCGVGTPAYLRAASPEDGGEGCPADEDLAIPPVLPFVDINLALKFNINERAAIRLEGGLHDLLYGGAAVGVRF